MSCEDCLTRRTFLAKSALAAAAAALATGCGNGEFGPPLPSHGGTTRPSGSVTIKVSNFPGLQTVGTLVAVAVERAAVRQDASSFLALSTICTHQGCDADIDGARNEVACPCHGSRFDNQGNVVNGPAQSPLLQLQTSYNAATDELTIT